MEEVATAFKRLDAMGEAAASLMLRESGSTKAMKRKRRLRKSGKPTFSAFNSSINLLDFGQSSLDLQIEGAGTKAAGAAAAATAGATVTALLFAGETAETEKADTATDTATAVDAKAKANANGHEESGAMSPLERARTVSSLSQSQSQSQSPSLSTGSPPLGIGGSFAASFGGDRSVDPSKSGHLNDSGRGGVTASGGLLKALGSSSREKPKTPTVWMDAEKGGGQGVDAVDVLHKQVSRLEHMLLAQLQSFCSQKGIIQTCDAVLAAADMGSTKVSGWGAYCYDFPLLPLSSYCF